MNRLIRQIKHDISRDPAMDVIRVVACFGVLSIHFFIYIEFYSEVIDNGREYVLVVMRSFFMYCVPMYVMLSGYLMCHKKPEIKYYIKIGKTICIYILAAVFCTYIFPRLYCALQGIFSLPDNDFDFFSFGEFILALLDYRAARYAWYIEMYLGLFILIPFLNILYNSIDSKNRKRLLLLSLILLTAVPSVLNVYCFTVKGWWKNPATLNEAGKIYETNQIFPSWWTFAWPITYYYIGCYLREYGLKIRTWLNGLLIVIAGLCFGAYNIWRSKGAVFQLGGWTDWDSFFNMIVAVLIFTFFMNLKYDHMPGFIKQFFSIISPLCLGIYLVSWCFDQLFYSILVKKVSIVAYRLDYFPIILPMIFLCSAIVSFLLLKVYELLERIINLVRRHQKNAV